MRILIADDNPVSRRLMEASLAKWEYDVVPVSDGIQAWEKLQRPEAPRLAVLDWMMPGLSGPDVCRRVRQLPNERYTYILLVTSRTEKEDLVEGLDAGADDYVTKPYHQSELRARLSAGRRIVQLQDALLAAQAALVEQATTDSLTRLWNRRSVLEILDRELARAVREHTPLGLVMVDLDGFKAVNDTFGHLAGDSVLREAARRMKASSRSYDSLGRYGGEEFLLILPGCDGSAAEAQAQRLRTELEIRPVEGPDGPISFTASLGATALDAGSRVSADHLLRTADAALYKAKQKGRNCVVFLPSASG